MDSDCSYLCYFQVLWVFFKSVVPKVDTVLQQRLLLTSRNHLTLNRQSLFLWIFLFVSFCCCLLFSWGFFCVSSFFFLLLFSTEYSLYAIHFLIPIKANPYWSNYTEPIAGQKHAGLFFLLFPLRCLERRRCTTRGEGGATLYKRYLSNCTGSDITLNGNKPVSPSIVKETLRLQRCWEKKKPIHLENIAVGRIVWK